MIYLHQDRGRKRIERLHGLMQHVLLNWTANISYKNFSILFVFYTYFIAIIFILVFQGPLRQRKGHHSNGNKSFKRLGLIKAIFKFIQVRNLLDIAAIKWKAVYTRDKICIEMLGQKSPVWTALNSQTGVIE